MYSINQNGFSLIEWIIGISLLSIILPILMHSYLNFFMFYTQQKQVQLALKDAILHSHMILKDSSNCPSELSQDSIIFLCEDSIRYFIKNKRLGRQLNRKNSSYFSSVDILNITISSSQVTLKNPIISYSIPL